MTPEEAAAELNGNQYGNEGSLDLWRRMKAANLVAVFGYSDDNVEFRGAIEDEVGAYNSTIVYVNGNGVVQNKCDVGDDCPNWRQHGMPIEAVWCPEGEQSGPCWAYKTDIPTATFDIMKDDELYCKGIVFKLADAAADGQGKETDRGNEDG